MPHFLLRLIPPRASFPFDMDTRERELMNAHAAFWRELTEKGTCLIFGPVLDPKGPWGLGIVEAEDEAAARGLFAEDPTVREGLNRIEIAPIRVAGMRKDRMSA